MLGRAVDTFLFFGFVAILIYAIISNLSLIYQIFGWIAIK